MSFFRSFHHSNKEKIQDHTLSGVQQWPYYRDLTVQSGHGTISSDLASLRHSRLHRSLYNLIYTPNDEVNYFIVYMESCSLSSYLKFILDINTFSNIIRDNLFDQQTIALRLFHRYLSVDAKELIPINNEIRRTTLSLICPSSDSTKPDPDCFRMAREFIWELIEQNAYPGYLQSIYHLNYQLELLTSNQIELHDILYQNCLLSCFIKFAEQEKIIHLIQFWIDVEDFYQTIMNRNNDHQTLTENALIIYDQYISLQAPIKLGFDDAIRARIECSICQPDINAGPSVDTFDQAVWIIYVILQREYFPRFLQSIIFYRYISDLMLKLRNKENEIPLSQQRNSSPCLNVNQEIRIQPKGRFSMGYIDPLGRFIRDPDVDSFDVNRKTTSNPIQFLANLVRNEQDEIAIEEAAARFAETFINEITNHPTNFVDE